MPHYAVRASFCMGRWSAKVCLPVRSSVLWPAAWVSCVDKSRGSKSVEVRRIWEVYDESLSFIPPAFWRSIRSSLLAGDVSYAWRIWSFFAEVSLVRAFVSSGGPVSESGFRFGRGAASFRYVSIGGPVVGKVRSDLGSGDGQAVHLLKILLFLGLSFSVVGLVVFYMFWMVFFGMALLCLVIWSFLLSGMLLFRLVLVVLFVVLTLLFLLLLVSHLLVIMFVFYMILSLTFCIGLLFLVGMLLSVVGALGCMRMIRFILTVGSSLTWWLLLLSCVVILVLLLMVVGSFLTLIAFDEQFRNAWLPFFCRAGRGAAGLSVYDREVGGWLPRLGEFDFPLLLGSDLYYVVQHKRVSASGLDGWGWRDLKAFPEAWFDWLAVVLSRVELDGVWPDGLLDAYVTMIPKSDGDSTPLGQRPLCVLPVVYRIWASVRLRHLDGWLRSWLPLSVFSAGGGRGCLVFHCFGL